MDQLPVGFRRAPEGHAQHVLFSQRWKDLTFIHWSAEPEVVAPLLPAGTYPDVLNGMTYVGLVPFDMRRIAIWKSSPVPYFGDFPETNVRLYSVDDQGRHGVVFRSLESSRLLPTLVGRYLCGVPYVWSTMSTARRASRMRYLSRRLWPQAGLASAIMVEIGQRVAEPTDLDIFLTARWGLHGELNGRTVWLPNWHAPWELYEAQLLDLDQDLTLAAGLPPLGDPDVHTRWSPGVDAVFGLPEPI